MSRRYNISRRIKNTIHTLLCILGCTLLAACHFGDDNKKNVLFIMSYDSKHPQYEQFLNEFQSAISKDSKYDTKIRVIYANLEYAPDKAISTLQQMRDSLQMEGFIPNIIITEDYNAAKLILSDKCKNIFDITHTPVILASVFFPDQIDVSGKENFCVWNNPIDFYENIQLACQLSEKNHVQIEIDNGEIDQLLLKSLSKTLNRSPFVINTLKKNPNFKGESLYTTYADNIVVTLIGINHDMYSTEWKEDSVRMRSDMTRTLLQSSNQYPSLVIKKDIYCDAIANKSSRPQFTAIHSDFANGLGMYLAGYFASYSTIAHDCATTAIKIFNGVSPSSLSGKSHHKALWMDYDAMKRLNMPYEKYCNRFTIINIPFSKGYPVFYHSIIWIIITIIFCILSAIIFFLNKWRGKLQYKKLKQIEKSRNISQLCLKSAENMPIESTQDIEKYLSYVHPAHAEEAVRVRESLNDIGNHNEMVYCAPKGDHKYNWWLFCYDITYNSIIGIIINKQEQKQFEELVQRTDKRRKEAEKRESFINNISNEVSKPLDIISNCCKQLAGDDISEEERKQIIKELESNTKSISQNLNDILLFSKIESSRLRYNFTEKEVSSFANDYFEHAQKNIPDHLMSCIIEGRTGVIVRADFDRLRDILNHYLSNAIKFTQKGQIVFGWQYHLDLQKCEFFVEDSGIGISDEKKEKLFDLFWQENEKTEGFGLGLNICKRLAEAMEGYISLKSQEGKGSRFSVWLNASAKQ